MKPKDKMKNTTTALVLVIAMMAIIGKTSAQTSLLDQTFVDPIKGKDANTCNAASPCLTIAKALAKTKEGGTITLLVGSEPDHDPGQKCSNPYDHITILKSITIQGAAGLSGKPCFLTTPSASIFIKPNEVLNPHVVVRLKGLRFVKPNGTLGSVGVSLRTGSGLAVEDCYFDSVPHAINFDKGVLSVGGTTFVDNTTGVWLYPNSFPKTATIEKCEFTGTTQTAIIVGENATADVKQSNFKSVNEAFSVTNKSRLVVSDSKVTAARKVLVLDGNRSVDLKNVTITN